MPIRRRLARFNRVFANRAVGRIIPRLPGFGAVHHRGRKSGREYRTPVKVFRRGEDYVISLAYGSNSDWAKNVLAADGCDLAIHGRRVRLVEPRIYVDEEQAELPAPIRMVLKRINAIEFLSLKVAENSGEKSP